MIEKLELTNFRGVKEGEIELGDLTIIMGSNNSGKTTILEALFLAPNPFRDVPYLLSVSSPANQPPPSSAASVLHELHRTLDSQGYVFLFYKYISDTATIKWNGQDYLEMVASSNAIYLNTNKMQQFPCQGETRIAGIALPFFGTLGLQQRNENVPDSRNKDVLIAPNSLLISSELMRYAHEYIRYNWARIANTKIPVEVAKDISKYVWENYVNITIEPHLGGKLSIFGLLSDGTRIRLGDLGSGAQAYILAKMLYEVYKPQILLYDDIEAHLNPRLLLSLAEWFSELNEKGVQVVITTHSLEAARIIAGVSKEAETILLLSMEEGLLRSQRISLDELEELISAGVDVRLAESMMF